jgi:hypothetical protein
MQCSPTCFSSPPATSHSLGLSAVDHPKLRAFLRQVRLSNLPHADIMRPRLDGCFTEARVTAIARVRDTLFF